MWRAPARVAVGPARPRARQSLPGRLRAPGAFAERAFRPSVAAGGLRRTRYRRLKTGIAPVGASTSYRSEPGRRRPLVRSPRLRLGPGRPGGGGGSGRRDPGDEGDVALGEMLTVRWFRSDFLAKRKEKLSLDDSLHAKHDPFPAPRRRRPPGVA